VSARIRTFVAALRGFLAGFTGMPAARLPEGRCARHALAERASRRKSCC
jgi:hypothetical protein